MIALSDFGRDLSSRSRARFLREHILKDAERVPDAVYTFDLAGVRTICHSFADELFGILVVEMGEQWFKEHVVLENAENHTTFILETIARRLAR